MERLNILFDGVCNLCSGFVVFAFGGDSLVHRENAEWRRLQGAKRQPIILFSLVVTLVDVMGEAYPELSKRKDAIQSIIQNEEELFIKTLDRGLEEFNKTVKKVKGRGSSVFPGNSAFILHDT